MISDPATLGRQLLGTFLEESFDGLERLEAGLLRLDEHRSSELIDELFRVVHSIKGGAGAVGIVELGALAHAMESVLDALRRGEPAAAGTTSLLLRGVDALRASLRERQEGRSTPADAHAQLAAQIEHCAARGAAAPRGPAPPATRPSAVAAETWRIDIAPCSAPGAVAIDPIKLFRTLADLGELAVDAELTALPDLARFDPGRCYLRWRATLPGDVPRAAIEDLLAWVDGAFDVTIGPPAAAAPAAPAAGEPAPLPAPTGAPAVAAGEPAPLSALTGAPAAAASAPAAGSIRVAIDKIDQLMNMVGELVITQSMLGELDGDGPLDTARLARIREGLGQLARNTRALQDSVMRLRSMPISGVFNRFPRLVRELGIRLGKEVVLEITGQSTELDKTVLEKLGDPLTHLVRNSIDHGIEPVADRLAAGKPRAGTIRLTAEHRGGDVVVEISDDGRGLDPERIAAIARQRGLIAPDAVLDDRAATQLVFLPGFSTAREVSEISGRGVGMDVVRRHVEELGGEIALDSRRGHGTRITLRLPLTLAIIDGQLVRIGDRQFVIPLLSIIESVAVEAARVSQLAGACEVYRLRDQLIPMIDLAGLLGMPRAPGADNRVMVVVATDTGQLGLMVDELMAQQQVVVKSLETNYQRVPGLSGATILGDGQVAFILDVIALGQAARAPLSIAA